MALMFPAAIGAAIVGWLALRPAQPNWIGVACAYAILLSPIAYATAQWSADGLQLAVAVALFTLVTPIVGVSLTAGVIYKRRHSRRAPLNATAELSCHSAGRHYPKSKT